MKEYLNLLNKNKKARLVSYESIDGELYWDIRWPGHSIGIPTMIAQELTDHLSLVIDEWPVTIWRT